MVPIKREETSIYLNKYKTKSPAIKRTQFHVVLSWACTVAGAGLKFNFSSCQF